MPTTLQRFANGDTNYIAKHNSNAGVLEATLNALDAIISGVTGAGALTIASAYEALFGTTVALIGSTSYTQSTASTNLTITSGYCWKQSVLQIVKSVSSTVLPFSGVAAGTYYIEIDASGAPTRVSSSTEPVYTVVWSGSSFTSVTRNAPIVWAAADWIAAQTSAALAASYDSLDARLEAGEAKAVLGDLARTYQSAALSKSVAGGTDVALSDAEANHQIITLTGALTANINVTIVHATSPKTWIVNNQTSGAFTLTFKGTTGTGVVLPQGSASIVCSNATNVLPVLVADTDTTLAANSDLRFATQKAVKTYIDGIVTGGRDDLQRDHRLLGQSKLSRCRRRSSLQDKRCRQDRRCLWTGRRSARHDLLHYRFHRLWHPRCCRCQLGDRAGKLVVAALRSGRRIYRRPDLQRRHDALQVPAHGSLRCGTVALARRGRRGRYGAD
jgi:hypothetical protein